jgi:molecular chaperone GrpE
VLEIETSDFPDSVVVEELRKGYLYKERVLRASMVKVARNPGSRNKVEVEEG